MTVSNQKIHAILAALQQGLFEEPFWSSFLKTLREITGADYASLVLRRSDAGYKDVSIRSCDDRVYSYDQYNAAEIAKNLKVPYGAIQLNQPYKLNEIIGIVAGNTNRNRDYIQSLTGSPLNHATGLHVTDLYENDCWLTIGSKGDDFEPWVDELLAQIAPHLRLATRTLSALEHERMRADIAGYAVLRLNYGWLTFDASGRIIDINPEAEHLFCSQPKLRSVVRDQPLIFSQPIQQKAFAEILTSYAERRCSRPRALNLLSKPWLDMLMVPVLHRPISGGRTPIAVGYVQGVNTNSTDRHELLMQLFGLTDSEARLALQMSQGKSIVEAAEVLNLTVETARNYTKRIYAKTDTRGNADLVRTILSSVIALT